MLRVWLSAQDIHRPRAGLAHALDRPLESIHVTLADTGGAFGSKGPPAPEVVVAAAAAIELGRPVKWVETRSENFLAAYQGRGVEGEVELALDARRADARACARGWSATPAPTCSRRPPCRRTRWAC